MATSKKKGIKASAQDNFLQPDAVTGLTGTDVGTNRAYNDGAVDLSWSLPATSPAATSYTITTTPATTTVTTGSSSTTYRFTGLAGGTSYTFTVRGTNAAGTANPTTSGSVTATTVPQAPQSVSASATSVLNNTVSWTIGATGGKAISGHSITGSDGTSYSGISASATSYVANDAGGGSQTYSVFAINDNGTSAAGTSGSVTTTPPFFPPYFVPPFFPPFFPFFPFFPPYFVPPFFPPFFPFFPFFPPFFPYFPFFPFFPPFFPFFPFFPPYFVPPFFPPFFGPFFPPFFPPNFVPQTYCVTLGYNVPSPGYPGNCPGMRFDENTLQNGGEIPGAQIW